MASPDSPTPSDLAALLANLRAAWPAARWEWDGRFRCALSTLDRKTEAQARAALAAAMPAVFTSRTLAGAPAAVAKICDGTGGLRGDQEAYAAELGDGTTAFCLWWPWGGGGAFSARVGAVSGGSAGELSGVLKSAFGV